MPYSSLLHTEPLSLWQSSADLYLHRRCSHTVLSQFLWGPCVLMCTRFVWALLASLVGMAFDSKHKFAPPTILLGLLLCPWAWDISSQPLQSLPSYWGFSDLGYGVSPHGHSRLRSHYSLLQSHEGFPVNHQLLEFAQAHVHWVRDAIQPSQPLMPSSPALNLSQHQGLSQWENFNCKYSHAILCLGRGIKAPVLSIILVYCPQLIH